jgi:hypothetical protein
MPIRERVLMHPDEGELAEFVEQASSPEQRRTPLSVLASYEQAGWSDPLPPPISLEKRWVAVHHLLTGSLRPVDSPLSRSVFGDATIGRDGDRGLARYLWADQVRESSAALSALTPEELRRRFDPSGLKAAWLETSVNEDDDDEDLFEELARYVDLLIAIYRIAAAHGNAMLIVVV